MTAKVPFLKKTLKNGILLVAERHPSAVSIAVGVWVHVGSHDENSKLSGVSHFIEHMVFKGTKNRTALQIASSLESVGGELNAFTEKELTCFHATVLKEDLDSALEILSELVLRPTFPKVEMEKERKVLIQELAAIEAAPEENIYDSFFRQVWKGHAMGQAIIGNRKTIQSLSRQALVGFFEDHYKPSRMVISVAGNVDLDKLTKACEKYFDTRGLKEKLPVETGDLEFHSRHWFQKSETDQLHALVGFPTDGVESERRYAYLLLSYILGGGMGSRLFQEVREKAALAYSVECDFVPFSKGGIFTIYSAISPRSIRQGLEVLGKVLMKVRDQGVSEEEVARVKQQLRGMILLSSEQMEVRQESLARNELILGFPVTVNESIEKIMAVTQREISELAKELFLPEKESLLLVGRNKPKIRKLSVFP